MKKIEIYSTPSCHFCHMAKDWLTEKGFSFIDYNVGLDTVKRAEMMEKSGQMGVPVIVVDDKDLVIGFDKKVLIGLLGVSGE